MEPKYKIGSNVDTENFGSVTITDILTSENRFCYVVVADYGGDEYLVFEYEINEL